MLDACRTRTAMQMLLLLHVLLTAMLSVVHVAVVAHAGSTCAACIVVAIAPRGCTRVSEYIHRDAIATCRYHQDASDMVLTSWCSGLSTSWQYIRQPWRMDD